MHKYLRQFTSECWIRTKANLHPDAKSLTPYHTGGNPAIPGKSNKSCLATDREIGLKGGGVNMRTGLSSD